MDSIDIDNSIEEKILDFDWESNKSEKLKMEEKSPYDSLKVSEDSE